MKYVSHMFSKRLKELRARKKLSQEELAIALDIPRTTIAGYESGARSIPREPRLKSIAHFFAVSIDYLLGHKDIENESEDLENQIISIIKSSTIHLDHKYSYTDEEKDMLIQILLSLSSMDKEERKIALDMLRRMTQSPE